MGSNGSHVRQRWSSWKKAIRKTKGHDVFMKQPGAFV
jgi:hypothetical protein